MLGNVLAGVGMGAASSLLGGDSGNQTVSSRPWNPQAEALQLSYKRARDQFSRQEQNPLPFFPGSTVAPLDSNYQQALQRAGAGAYGQPMAYNSGFLGNLANTAPGSRDAYARVLNNPLSGVNMDTVSQAINNPVLEGQIDAVNRDVSRGLQDSLKSTRYGAALSGNAGSTTRALSEGLQARAAGDRMADVAASMRGNAYGMGYNTAANQALANQQGTLQAATGYANLANMFGRGIDQRAGLIGQNLGGQMQAGQLLTGDSQQRLNEQMQRYYYPEQQARGNIEWLKSIAGNPPGTAGSSMQSTQGLNPAAAAAAGGMYGAGQYMAANPNWNPWSQPQQSPTGFGMNFNSAPAGQLGQRSSGFFG